MRIAKVKRETVTKNEHHWQLQTFGVGLVLQWNTERIEIRKLTGLNK
jgi:hypothetical protein